MNLLSKKILTVLFLTTFLYAQSEKVSGCPEDLGGKIACSTMITIGGIIVFFSEMTNRILPTTNIKVRMPDGSIQSAKLTSKGQGRRIVERDDILDLDCRVNEKPTSGDYGYAICELKFPNITPRPESVDYYQRIGKQPSWSLGANKEGFLNDSIIILSHPIVWPIYK